MDIKLSLESAKAIFDDLSAKPSLSPAYAELHGYLKPLCSINLEWHPHGTRGLPTINGVGWAVMFNELPSDSDKPETSLRNLDNEQCYILTGDHREAYSAVAIQGYEALKSVYDELKTDPKFKNGWSDDAT